MVHGTIEEAQKAELTLLFPPTPTGEQYAAASVVQVLLEQADAIIAVLRPKSRPRKVAVKAVRVSRKGRKAASEDSGE